MDMGNVNKHLLTSPRNPSRVVLGSIFCKKGEEK
jgi:hypothetical protein